MDPLKCHECAATGLISAIRLDKCYHIFCMKCERRLPVTEQIHKSQHFRNCYKCSVCGLYCQLDSTTQLKNQELQRSRGLNVPDSRRRREDHSSTTHGKLPSHPEPAYWTPNDTVQNKRIEEKDRRMMATMKTSSKSNDDSYRSQHFSTERAESRKQLDMKILSKKNEITGLQNTKLTCAVNAVVQVLAQTPGFSETIYEFGGKCKQEAVLANVLINSITDVNNASGIINAEGLQEEMITRRNSFHFWRQHDCLSFLLFLLEALEEELGNDSMKLFTGQMRNRFKYDNCDHTEHSSLQNFKSLCIPMNNSENSVEKYLKMLFRAENLIDSGMYCRSCGKGTASRKLLKHDICSKELLIEESPQILVLQLAKFEEVKDIYGHTKLDKRHVPMLYSDTLQLQEGESPSRVKYELFAIISHLGTIEGGHYVSYVQTIQSQRECARFDRHDRRSSTWYHCTDSVVTRLEPEAGYPTCPNAYILFYHKQPRK